MVHVDQENQTNGDVPSTPHCQEDDEPPHFRNAISFRDDPTNFNGGKKCKPTNLRGCWRKNPCSSLPQYTPLYMALFCSYVAIMLSVRTHLSTEFVALEEPIRVSPYFKNVDYIGLSKWELCAIKHDALESIAAAEGSDDGNNTLAVTSKLPVSTLTTFDEQRNVTTHVVINYHYTPHSLKQSTASWMNEPDHDDILASGDFPYNDDDAFDAELPMDYWSCRQLQFTSKNAANDKMWNISRVFFMVGSILGTVSTSLLVALIIFRGRGARRRRRYQQEALMELRQHKQLAQRMQRQCSNDETAVLHPGPNNVSQHCQTLSEANKLLSLDTDSSGYRPISICFMLSYLLQSLTLLFLDSELCRDHVCSMSSGAQGLLAGCVLWVISGLLVLVMLKTVRSNSLRVRRFKRRISRSKTILNAAMDEAVNDISHGEDDAKSLLPMKSEVDITINSSKEEDSQSFYEDSELNTTTDTEASKSSLSILSEDRDMIA